MKRMIVLLVFGLLLPMSTDGVSAGASQNSCLPFDTRCKDRVEAGCEPDDYLCDTRGGSSQTQSSQSYVQYSVSVSCDLVLEDMFGGISGYCTHTLPADLDHCVVEGQSYKDEFHVDFLCSKDRPDLMDKSARNEVRVKDLDIGVRFGDPYWLLCDEGMASLATNRRCYDSDFSNGDDWKTGCVEDKRINNIHDYPDTFVWYVCT